jgi:hypothetical protein
VFDKPKIHKWVLAPHAAIRILERKIAISDIAEIIQHPDWALPQGPKWILAKHFKTRNDNMLAAVVMEKEGSNLWIVLTVMVHFEIKKK